MNIHSFTDWLYCRWSTVWQRLSWQVILAFGAGIFLWRNLLMPMVGDDYSYAFIWDGANAGNLMDGIGPRQKISSFADLLTSQWSHYFTWGGRVPALLTVQFFAWHGSIGRLLFAFANTLFFVLLVYLLFWLAAGRIESLAKSKTALLLLLIGLFFAIPAYIYTMIWLTGACVYLWTAAAICAFLLPYSLAYWQTSFWQDATWWHQPAMLLLGLLAGWSIEAGSLVTVLLTLAFLILFHQQKRLQCWQLTGFAGLVTGMLLLMLAPGSLMRVELMRELAPDYTMPAELMWTPLMFLYNFLEGFLPVLIGELPLFIPILLYFWKGPRNHTLTRYILLWVSGSFLVLFAMMFSPDFRAHAGYHGVIFLLIAAATALRAILPLLSAWCAKMRKARLAIAGTGFSLLLVWLAATTLCLVIETSYNQQWAKRWPIIAEHRQDNPIIVPAIEIPYHLDKITGNRSITDVLLMFGADLESTPTDNRSLMFAQFYGLKGIIIDHEIDWEKYGETNEW